MTKLHFYEKNIHRKKGGATHPHILTKNERCDLLVYTRSGQKLNSILLTFQNQGSVVKSAFSTNAQSRFASVVVEGDLGPACQLKKPFKGPRQRRGSCWEELQTIVFP